MARRLVRIPVFPSVTTSDATTFWARGAGEAKTGERTREPIASKPSHVPAAAPALPRRKRLRFMDEPPRIDCLYSIPSWTRGRCESSPFLSQELLLLPLDCKPTTPERKHSLAT